MEKEGKNIWLKCLSLIQKQVLPEKFKTLFEPIRAVRFKDDVLTIQVASAYVYEVLEGEYIDILKSALRSGGRRRMQNWLIRLWWREVNLLSH